MDKCCSCCASCWGYSKVNKDDDDDEAERQSLVKDPMSGRYEWEQHVLDAMIMPTKKVKKSAIISYNDGTVRAAAPSGFRPDKKGIKDIIRALQGDTSGIADRGIALKSGTPVYTPGKLDAGKAIYGSDGRGGGCSIFKTNECILIALYDSDLVTATRLASEVAEYMKDQGH